MDKALEPDDFAETDANGPYVLASTDKLVARLDEHLTGDIFEDED